MRIRILSATALVAFATFFAPLAVQAIFYAPGETLNPACAPTDPNCGVTGGGGGSGNIGPGVGGQIPYYAASGNVLTATSSASLLSITLDGTARPVGNELITNGTFTGGTAGWTLEGTAVFGANNVVSTSEFGSLFTTFPVVAGHTYLLTFNISNANAPASITLDDGNTGHNFGPFNDGQNAVTFTTDFTVDEFISFSDTNFAPGDTWTLDDVSIKEISSPAPALKVIGFDGATWLSLGGDTRGNIALGSSALSFNTTGNKNTAMGSFSLPDLNITANDGSGNNTALGNSSGQGLITGINNTILGANVTVADPALSNNIIIADGAGNQRIKVDNLGTVSLPSLACGGPVSADGSGVLNCSSDERLKTILGSYTPGLSAINTITPILYTWKPGTGLTSSSTILGFSAQNVQAVIPEAVSTNSRGSLQLNEFGVLAAAVNAIKELDAKVQILAGTAPSTLAANLNSFANGVGQSSSAFFGGVLTKVEGAVAFMKGLVVDALTVGSPSRPTGVTVYDKKGRAGCLEVNDVTTGGVSVLPGVCGSQTSVAPAQILTPIPLPPPERVVSSTTESTTSPEITTPLLPNTGSLSMLFLRTLDIGSSGPDVALLQSVLMQKGFLYLPADVVSGYFGELTREAVMKYQTSVALEPVGIVGPATRAALNAELSGRAM